MLRKSLLSCANFMFIASLSIPAIIHPTSPETVNHQTSISENTKQEIAIAKQSSPATLQTNTQVATDKSQEQDSISMLKVGRTFVKTVDLQLHGLLTAFFLHRRWTGKTIQQPFQGIIDCGLVGTMVALIESICKDLKKPLLPSLESKYHSNNHATQKNKLTYTKLVLNTLCKLSGIIGHGYLLYLKPKNPGALLLTLPNLAFLGYRLHEDYKTYIDTKNIEKDKQSSIPTTALDNDSKKHESYLHPQTV